MKKLFQLTIILIIIGTVSCRKTKTSNNPSTNVPLLTQYVLLDTTVTAPNDTLVLTKLVYDNSKRVIQMLHYEYPSSVAVLTQSFSFYYNNADTTPYKLVYYENIGGNSGSDTVYYFYAGATNTVIADSTVSPGSTTTNKYAYSNNIVIRNQVIMDPGVSSYTDTFYQTKSNGNIISQVDTLYHNSQVIIQNFSYQFDSHPNPLYKPYIPITVLEEDGLNESPQQRNNYTSINEYSNDGGSSIDATNTICSFTYGVNGYPVKAVEQDNSQNPPAYGANTIFIYQ
jgi:hypothetical protein